MSSERQTSRNRDSSRRLRPSPPIYRGRLRSSTSGRPLDNPAPGARTGQVPSMRWLPPPRLDSVGFDLVPFYTKVASYPMSIDQKFSPIRKGLLEFLVLKIVGGAMVYVPDILKRLSDTEFETQEGTLYPLLSKLRREGLVHYESQ